MRNEIDLLARTIWAEARSEGERGMQAVANVIKNRADKGGYFGRSIVDVATKDFQFSAWNIGDPNRSKLLAVTDENPEFRKALDIAKGVLKGTLSDITEGADHYHTYNINPSWAASLTKIKQIGDHIFYRS